MNNDDPRKGIPCSILRQGDYKPGTWLLSDRFQAVSLLIGLTDSTVGSLEANPHFEPAASEVPFVMLVREPRLGRDGAVYAKPLSSAAFDFGGNWLWSDDPRFPAPHPIRIHDVPRA